MTGQAQAQLSAAIIEHTALPPGARRLLAQLREDAPAPIVEKPLAPKAAARGTLAAFVLAQARHTGSVSAAAEHARESLRLRMAPDEVRDAAHQCASNGLPSRASLIAWAQRYELAGTAGVRGQHRGSRRTWYDWMPRALHFWLQPQRPHMGTVAFWLRGEGFADALDHRVRSFLKALPETLGDEAIARVGKHYHEQNIRPYRVLDYTRVMPGMVYEGDGHTCDFYVAHPITGKTFQPELTVWLDWASNYCAGFYLWDRESALNTLFALSRALLGHDHVPGAIHVDPGSGFKNRMIADDALGYCARLGISPIFARAGNARGKGLVEGFFHHFEDRCGKRFATYCGVDRMDDTIRRLDAKVKRGDLPVPAWDETVAVVGAYIDRYNHEPQPGLGGATPADLWAGLTRHPVHIGADALIRPRTQATVRHWRVTFKKRLYQHQLLAQFEGRRMILEYDVFNLAALRVLTLDGVFVCEAPRIDAQPALSDSLFDDIQRTRARGQIKLKQAQIAEIEARAGLTQPYLTPEALESFAALSRAAERLEAGVDAPAPDEESSEPLDIYSTDY